MIVCVTVSFKEFIRLKIIKMEEIAAEVSQKLKSAIKAKLMELGAYVDDELSNYVMVMVTNRRSKADMDRELHLFLGASTCAFTTWLQSVWMKLEQVTVTNSGIETGKRKTTDKKRKGKKLPKSSSESEDDKKYRRKRKSSSSDLITKDTKKRKITSKSGSESNKADSGTDSKKLKKDELHSNTESDSETDNRVENFANKKTSKDVGGDSSVDEDEFLNIKEDFESEFLSENEISENVKSKVPLSEEILKKVPSSKPNTEATIPVAPVKRIKEGENAVSRVAESMKEIVDRSKHTSSNVLKSIPTETTEKGDNYMAEKLEKMSSTRKPLIRDRNIGSPTKSKSRRHSPSSRSRSRSRSFSPTKGVMSRCRISDSKSSSKDKVGEDFNTKIQRSRLKSAALNSGSNLIKVTSRSRSRSPLRSTTGKQLNTREKSPTVMDARELINRKRAMSQAVEHSSTCKEERILSRRLLSTKVNVDINADVTVIDDLPVKQNNDLGTAKTTVSGGKIIRLRGRDKSKENFVVENVGDDNTKDRDSWIESGSGDGATNTVKTMRRHVDNNNKYGRFVVNKSDGKRNVIVQPTAKSPPPGNKKIDLRGIKRTVYVDDDGSGEKSEVQKVSENGDTCLVDNKDEKIKARKCVVNQIAKYIKDEPSVSSIVVKLPKPARPKTTAAQSASSSLIRRAVADAHKSLTSSKEELSKKKETLDNKSGISSKDKTNESKSDDTNELQICENDEDEVTEQKEIEIEDEERLSLKSCESEEEQVDDTYMDDDKILSEYNNINEAEEYDPSLNMPQFVVTLTGLDSKLYSQEDVDDLNTNFNDEFMDTTELEDNKMKPKLQERCKYYPNCLAGDQCLYYHPTIPCKLFPNCKFGNNCLYVHPKCKFDNLCTRYDCTFLHTTPKLAVAVSARHVPPSTMNGQPCKFYYNCVNPVCPFQHPKICRFDRFCTNKNCTFSHTSLSHVSAASKDKLKWSRPKENDANKTDVEPKSEYNVTNENQ